MARGAHRSRRRAGIAAAIAAVALGAGVSAATGAEPAPECEPAAGAACAGADLALSSLPGADLRGADLRGADLSGSLLHGAALGGADLRGADLRGATLTGADLSSADLDGADLADANLSFTRGADLDGAYVCRTATSSAPRGGSARDCSDPEPAGTIPDDSLADPAAVEQAPAPGQWRMGAPSAERRSARKAGGQGGNGKQGKKGKRIKLSVNVIGAGKVVSGPAVRKGKKVARAGKISCPDRCDSKFPRRSKVALGANPQAGYQFSGFSGRTRCAADSGKAECVVRIGKAAKGGVTARFTPIEAPPGDCQVGPAVDSDGDRIPDCTELAGWKLTVVTPSSLSGAGPTTRTITSDPNEIDSDGDGIDDGTEFLANADPTSTDTDSDNLGDGAEINTFHSLPNNADTDNDSVPPGGGPRDPRLFDRSEALTLKTNPRVSDTDGDSLSDFIEVVREGTNPRVSDLPQVDLVAVPGLSNPQLDFSYTVEESTGTETEQSHTTGQASSEETSTETSRETTNEHTFESQTGGKCGFNAKGVGCSVSQKFTDSTTSSVTRGSTSGFSNTQEQSQEYEQIASKSAERKVTLGPDGCFQIVLRLENSGPVSVSVGDLQVLTLAQDPADPSQSKLLTTLEPIQGQVISDGCPATAPGFGPVEIAPGSSTNVAFSQQVGTPILLDYLSDPTPITYELGPISMKGSNLNNDQVDFLGSVATKVDDRTADVEVDFGNGSIDDFEVAAQSEYGANGKFAGVTLGEALGPRLGNLDARYTATSPSGISALRDPESGDLIANAADQRHGVWVIFGDAEGIGDPTVDWQDVVLRPDDKVAISYVRDSDSDKLPDGYEAQIGTDPTKTDTDNDALGDREEAIDGWTVPFARGQQASYKVFPSPLSCDADGDDSPDGSGPGNALYGPCPTGQGPESVRLTDPNDADTNGDGQPDGAQPLPDALRAVPVGGRMPVLLRTWGGEGMFGGTMPMGLAVDPNQPLVTNDGKAAPIDSYVVARDPSTASSADDQVLQLRGNPRSTQPDPTLDRLDVDDGTDFIGNGEAISAGAVGIGVAEGQIGTGDDAGSPVVVNYYAKNTAGVDPAQATNAFTTFNGTTGEDEFLGTDGAGVAGAYGGNLCCFKSPVFSTTVVGNGPLDIVGRNAIVIAHGTGGFASDPDARASLYRNFGDPIAERTTNYGVNHPQSFPTPQEPGDLIDPSGVAADVGNGRLYVADQIANSDFVFASLTRFNLATGAVEAFASDGEDPGPLVGVRGVAVDPDGRYIYALASGDTDCNGMLLKYSPSLTLLGRIEVPTPLTGSHCATSGGDYEDIDVDNGNGIWLTQPHSQLMRFFFYPFGP